MLDRPALTGRCYRMLGSAVDADDAVQETIVRAWRTSTGLRPRSAADLGSLPNSHSASLFREATDDCAPAPESIRLKPEGLQNMEQKMSIKHINAYIHFNGAAEKAINLYQADAPPGKSVRSPALTAPAGFSTARSRR